MVKTKIVWQTVIICAILSSFEKQVVCRRAVLDVPGEKTLCKMVGVPKIRIKIGDCFQGLLDLVVVLLARGLEFIKSAADESH